MSDYKQIIDIIKNGSIFLIASHAHPDGDAIGSTIALAKGIENFGKKVVMFNADEIPYNLKFLPYSGDVVHKLDDNIKFDATFMVDCSQRERIEGDVAKLSTDRLGKTVLIDHHKIFSCSCDVVCIDEDAAATGEVIARILRSENIKITKEIATNLFCTFVVDTGSFRYSNTSPHLLQEAARLVEAGANPWEISMAMDESNPPSSIALLKLVLNTFEMNGKVAWMTLTQQMFKESGASLDVAEEYINYPRSIAGVEVAILFRELAKEKHVSSKSDEGGRVERWKVSFRSKGDIDVQKIASVFKGGGHSHAAGCTLAGNLASVKSSILNEVKKYL